MSGLVFAGASQYAALDQWTAHVSFVGLLLATLAVNARHLVLGATLHDYLASHAPLRRYAAAALISDANWAATQRAIVRGERDLGHLVGGGLVLWMAWVIGTFAGVTIGDSLGHLERFGVDVLMPAFFVCALIGMMNTRNDIPAWVVAGLVAGAASGLLPGQWAVIIGALSGGIAGALRDARR
jgi:predicted branched-subunit amino acid permease